MHLLVKVLESHGKTLSRADENCCMFYVLELIIKMLCTDKSILNEGESHSTDTNPQTLKEQNRAISKDSAVKSDESKVEQKSVAIREKPHDELQYLELIQHIMDHGVLKSDRTGNLLQFVFNFECF